MSACEGGRSPRTNRNTIAAIIMIVTMKFGSRCSRHPRAQPRSEQHRRCRGAASCRGPGAQHDLAGAGVSVWPRVCCSILVKSACAAARAWAQVLMGMSLPTASWTTVSMSAEHSCSTKHRQLTLRQSDVSCECAESVSERNFFFRVFWPCSIVTLFESRFLPE
jgi:hypothetical protein